MHKTQFNAYLQHYSQTPCKPGVSAAARWRHLKKTPTLVEWKLSVVKRHRHAKETGFPDARANSAVETRKVEITESLASNSKQGWRISLEFDWGSVQGQKLQRISHLNEKKKKC